MKKRLKKQQNSVIDTKPTLPDDSTNNRGSTMAAKTLSNKKPITAEGTVAADSLQTHPVDGDLLGQAADDFKTNIKGVASGQAARTLKLRNDIADRIVKTFARLKGNEWPQA